MKLGAIHYPTPNVIRPLSERASLDLMTVPKQADWFKLCPPDNNPLGNQNIGSCVPVARYRTVQMRIANTQGYIWPVTEAMTTALYEKLTGYDPATGVPDIGTSTVADMTDWCKHGLQVNDQLLDVPLWATVSPLDIDHISIAIAHCGPVQVTLNLPIEAQDLTTWSKPPGKSCGWFPGTWGEHRVICGAFIDATRDVLTWGKRLSIHPDFWEKYVLGVDVTLSRATWFDATGLAPSNLDFAALETDMASA